MWSTSAMQEAVSVGGVPLSSSYDPVTDAGHRHGHFRRPSLGAPPLAVSIASESHVSSKESARRRLTLATDDEDTMRQATQRIAMTR